MVLHVFTSLLGGVPSCIPYGLYNGTPLGGTTRETLEGYPGRVLSSLIQIYGKNGSLLEHTKSKKDLGNVLQEQNVEGNKQGWTFNSH